MLTDNTSCLLPIYVRFYFAYCVKYEDVGRKIYVGRVFVVGYIPLLFVRRLTDQSDIAYISQGSVKVMALLAGLI